MPKVAIVCSTLNQLGGPAFQIRNYYRHLQGRGVQFTLVFCTSNEPQVRDFMLAGGVLATDMIFIPHAKKRSLLPFILALRDLFRREKFDVVHAFETQTQVLAGLSAWWAGQRQFLCHCVAEFLPSTISAPKRVLFRFLNGGLKYYFSKTIVVSAGLAQELVVKGLRPQDKIEILHVGIPVAGAQGARFFYSGFDAGAPVIGALSRLSVEKGLDRFVKAAALVLKKIPLARFIITGDGKEKEYLQALAREYGLGERIEFRPWVEDVLSALFMYDIYVLPSQREGLPITLLEAMVAGRPCVASDIDGVREIVDHGVDGVLVDTGDTAAFAKAIISLCMDPHRSMEMGSKAFDKVKRSFDIEFEMHRMCAIYDEMTIGSAS